MNKDTIRSVEMRFSEQGSETWVELIFVFKDGSRSTICHTECDATVVRVDFVPQPFSKRPFPKEHMQ